MSDSSDISELRDALSKGDPQKVLKLIEAGADVHYSREHGYNALIDSLHGRDVLDLLRLLIDHGVNLSATTSYSESGLRVLSRIGRFDGVRLLLESGADKSQLEWTPLMEAVALGSLGDVQTVLDGRPELEACDWWSRTAWLIALLIGDIAKATLLRDHGAQTEVCGRCGRPPLFYPIQGHHPDMLRWLLQQGADVHKTSDHGTTALMEAVEHDAKECVSILLDAGANVTAASSSGTALEHATSRSIIMRLLEAGADPADADQRAILGLGHRDDGGNDKSLETISQAEFKIGAVRVFGNRNPDQMRVPFWEAMIRAGVGAYTVRSRFEGSDHDLSEPFWRAQRFGQSLTQLPDGRAIQIAGEHEDSYDPDFCIYNDVFVHAPDGSIAIYGYPEDVFPPTDFHTATLIGDHIFIIGSLGYAGTRRYGETPVYRFDIHSFRIEQVTTRGVPPGWIYGHRAAALGTQAIRVWGGKVVTESGDNEKHEDNAGVFVLDLKNLEWRRE
jgi:ankyrin repeat protein